MFEHLDRGTLSVVSTDHSVYHEEHKEVDNWWDAPFGANSIQYSLPVFHEIAVNQRGYSLPFLVSVMCANPAETFGLPRKGTLDIGTDADLVYQSEIFSNDLGFDVAIPNGTYDVTLHFSEITFDAEDARVFDVSVQGRSVLEDYDIVAEVGQFAADVVTVKAVEVTDNVLSISTTTDTNFSKFSGIEIRESNPVETPFGLDAGGAPGAKKAWLRRPTTEGQELVVFEKEVPDGVDVSAADGVNTASTDAQIDGTVRDVLYQTEFWGEDLSFDVTIPNGNYDVYLHFAEIAQDSAGVRVFDINVQGEQIRDDYDIYAEVGANTADVIEVRNVAVTDGELSIETTTEADNTKISVTGNMPMNSPGTPGQNSIGRKAQSVVAVELTIGQNMRFAASV